MNRIRKSVATMVILGGAVGTWFGGQTLVRNVAFAQQQREVETSREQLQTANDLTSAFRNVGKVVEPAVVNINVRKAAKGPTAGRNNLPDDMLRRFFRDRNNPGGNEADPNGGDNGADSPDDSFDQVGTGSGVILSVDGKTGYILTNNHVAGGATELLVTLADGRRIENAKLVGADPKSDLAVIKIEADHLIAAKWGDSATLQKGDWIMAFGSPFGYVGSMTHGIVSALDRTNVNILAQGGYEDFIQVDAPINPGNSGGPLVNLQGQVVGINTAIASRSGGFQGIGFAIPSNEAKFVYNELKNHGKVTRGWLGVSINDVAREAAKARYLKYTGTNGVFVEDELPNSPAVGKLQNDDIITAVNGKSVENTLQLRNTVASLSPGSDVKMTVFRNGKEEEVSLKLAEQPDDLTAVARNNAPGMRRGPGAANATADTFGMRLANPDDRINQRFGLADNTTGAVVLTVQPRSEAAKAGIRPGDVLTEIDHKGIKDAKQAGDLLAKHDVAKGVLVRITSVDGTSRSVLIGGTVE